MSGAPAAGAAALWGVLAAPPRPVSERENAVYELRFADGRRGALRLHRPGYQTDAAIRSELELCAALAARGFPTPAPLRSMAGRLVEDAGGRRASVVAWLEGRELGAAPLADAPRQIAGVGRLLARLHRAIDAAPLPGGFIRPRWDAAGYLGEAPLWGRFWQSPALRPGEAERLHAFRDRARAALARVPDFGPIHADVLRENVMAAPDGPWLIDFDDCGPGWRAYDLATALFQSLDDPDFPAQRAALLSAYAGDRPEAPDMGPLLPLFLALRACASVGWLSTRRPPGHPGHRQRIDTALRLIGGLT